MTKRKKPLSGAAKRKRAKTAKVVVQLEKLPPRFDQVANQMLKGFTLRKLPDQETVEQFRQRYKDIIIWVEANSPTRFSVGVLGAICKAVLWYGKDRMLPFCEALKKGMFNGHGDPAHVLYLWLMGRNRFNTKDTYQRTVTAIRYFIDGREMLRIRNGSEEPSFAKLDPAKTDIFTWDASFTRMTMRHTNNSRTQVKVFTESGAVEEQPV
jgi:hypothetical protein